MIIHGESWLNFRSEELLRREAKRREPSYLLLWSAEFLAIGAPLLWWGVRSGWPATVDFLIGSRFLLSGSLKLAEALRNPEQAQNVGSVSESGDRRFGRRADHIT